MARRRRVAVLVDDSPGSMRACRYGAKHLLDKNTDVMLVTAVHDSHDPRAVRRSVYERAYASETPKGDRHRGGSVRRRSVRVPVILCPRRLVFLLSLQAMIFSRYRWEV